MPDDTPRVEFGKDAHDREVDRLEDLFWEANRHTLDKPKGFRPVGPPSEDHWTWKFDITPPHRLYAKTGLSAEDAPECAIERNAKGGVVGYRVLQHHSWDGWAFDEGQRGESKMDFDQIAEDFENRDTNDRTKVRTVDNAIYFNHLPGGYREFPNKKAAAAWLRENLPDVEFKD